MYHAGHDHRGWTVQNADAHTIPIAKPSQDREYIEDLAAALNLGRAVRAGEDPESLLREIRKNQTP